VLCARCEKALDRTGPANNESTHESITEQILAVLLCDEGITAPSEAWFDALCLWARGADKKVMMLYYRSGRDRYKREECQWDF
jgi:hypothetical protein